MRYCSVTVILHLVLEENMSVLFSVFIEKLFSKALINSFVTNFN